MNKTRNLVEMGEFYATTVFTESAKKTQPAKFPGKDTFAKAESKVGAETVKTGKAFNEAGPEKNNKTALKKAIEPSKKDSHYDVNKFSSRTYEKMEVQNINNSMNKSIFDRLYEDVMSDNINTPEDLDQADVEALELPGSEAANEEGEVTITLDRELAKKLHEVLMSVLETEEEEPESEDSYDEVADEAAEEEEEEEEPEVAAEATELKELPTSAGASLQSKNNKVAGVATSHVAKGKADGKVSAEIDAKGTTVPDSKGRSLESKSNKVHSKTSKVGTYLAGLK